MRLWLVSLLLLGLTCVCLAQDGDEAAAGTVDPEAEAEAGTTEEPAAEGEAEAGAEGEAEGEAGAEGEGGAEEEPKGEGEDAEGDDDKDGATMVMASFATLLATFAAHYVL